MCTDANAYVSWAGETYLWIDDTRSPDWSNEWGNGGLGDYYADADMWNANGYPLRQKSVFCDHSSWYAEVTANNSTGDGAVKTYPNVHRDFIDWNTGIFPSLSSFSSIPSTFAHKSPGGSGLIYNWAYDIWLGGVASPTGYEVMIWTENGHQLPFGSKVRSSVSLGGRSWDLWRTSDGSGLAFYPTNDAYLTSGSYDLKVFLTYLQSQGFVRQQITLGQIGYGVEVVSTGNVAQRFDVTDFSVAALP